MSSSYAARTPTGAGMMLVVGLLLLPKDATADAIYKSVDAAGNVTYSDNPSTHAVEVEKVTVPPEPNVANVQQVLESRQQLEQAGARLEQDRQAKYAQEAHALQAAEQALQQARIRWEQASIQREGDWQYMQGGGRHLNESYFRRIQDAEQALRDAEAAVLDARQRLP